MIVLTGTDTRIDKRTDTVNEYTAHLTYTEKTKKLNTEPKWLDDR